MLTSNENNGKRKLADFGNHAQKDEIHGSLNIQI